MIPTEPACPPYEKLYRGQPSSHPGRRKGGLPIIEFQITIHIDRPPEVVNAAFINPDNIVHYTKDLVKFEIVSRTPDLAGSVARLHYSQNGRPHVMEDRMLEADPGKRYLSQVSGEALEARVETVFVPSGEGTDMTMRWSGKGKVLLLKLVFPFMRRRMAREAMAELETFKRLVETRGADFAKPPANDAGR